MKSVKWMAGLTLLAYSVGCDDGKYEDYAKAPLAEEHAHDHDHGHDHGGHEGKHGGHILELDDAHGHHAELVFDKATRDISLYFYGAEIGVAKPATGVAFELMIDGKEVVLESKASPLEGETEATCSRYVIAGSQLPENIKGEEQLDGHFHVTIDGKEFAGEMHAHSHDEHSHDEHKHDDHAHEGEAHKDDKAPAKAEGEKPAEAAPAKTKG
jgi:hypothetical protein